MEDLGLLFLYHQNQFPPPHTHSPILPSPNIIKVKIFIDAWYLHHQYKSNVHGEKYSHLIQATLSFPVQRSFFFLSGADNYSPLPHLIFCGHPHMFTKVSNSSQPIRAHSVYSLFLCLFKVSSLLALIASCTCCTATSLGIPFSHAWAATYFLKLRFSSLAS